MTLLWTITLLWAFSFSLIGVYLAGNVDPWFSALSRTVLAALVFLPFLRPTSVTKTLMLKLMAIGAVQIGLMYSFYYHSFLYLSVPEVLLFTVMTPVYITLLNDLLNKSFNRTFLTSALIAMFGAITIRFTELTSDYFFGLLLVQGANLCFAIGQVSYKRLSAQHSLIHHQSFGFFFIGASCVLALGLVLFGNLQQLPTTGQQWGILIYLGLIASGIGYFVWNVGLTRVSVGELAVMNNALIPAGILVNLFIWNKEADLIRLGIGSLIIFAALVHSKRASSG
ncbi:MULTISPECIES: EamA family transporter [unclassified Pseudoalteromonas]|uniref:EamA family transporter n=1 Tax=unclassified Pseudoalteromonas TaxID=194690 RepID=UPI000F6468F2|nr:MULTISPECIES: EamA family transporter [unclassified Pseudoalteromonas]RRS07513.1 EamA family transporter [Pseudoalteromonas sp. J010]RXF01299.1 EamA family transporter [Pseudoalteromonas sp. PS5]